MEAAEQLPIKCSLKFNPDMKSNGELHLWYLPAVAGKEGGTRGPRGLGALLFGAFLEVLCSALCWELYPGCFPLSSPCFHPGALGSWMSALGSPGCFGTFCPPQSPATRGAGHGGSPFRAGDQTVATRGHPCLSPLKESHQCPETSTQGITSCLVPSLEPAAAPQCFVTIAVHPGGILKRQDFREQLRV